MPYIDREAKNELELNQRDPKTSGELNYLMTMLALDYLNAKPKVGYTELAEVLSAFEGAKMEFYRRRVAPYEDIKIAVNGDVY